MAEFHARQHFAKIQTWRALTADSGQNETEKNFTTGRSRTAEGGE